MNITNNNCNYLTIEDTNFQSFLNNSLVEKVEVSVQHNCCTNLIKEEEAYLDAKIVATNFDYKPCASILEYTLKLAKKRVEEDDKLTWHEAIQNILKFGMFFDTDVFCCPDNVFEINSECPVQPIINVYSIVNSFAPEMETIFCSSDSSSSDSDSSTIGEDIFNINPNFEIEKDRLFSLIGTPPPEMFGGTGILLAIGGAKDCETILTTEHATIDLSIYKEYGSFNGDTLLGVLNNFLEEEIPNEQDRRDIVVALFYRGFSIVCIELCGEHRIFIGSNFAAWGTNASVMTHIWDCTILEQPIEEFDETLVLYRPLEFTCSLIGTTFNTSNIEDYISIFTILSQTASLVSVTYVDDTTFKVLLTVNDTNNPFTIKIGIEQTILNCLNPFPILEISMWEDGEYHTQTLQYIFDTGGILHIPTSNTFEVYPILFEDYMTNKLLDGIYKVTVTFYYFDGTEVQFYNCMFVECNISCTLAKYMANNLGSPMATELAMIYQALKDSANCACICEDSCKLFEYLWSHLYNIQIPENCGC